MSDSLDIHFLDSHSIGEPRALEDLVHVFLDAGFTIEDFTIDTRAERWTSDPEAMRTLLALADQAQDFSFTGWNTEWRLEVRQYVAWGERKMGQANRAYIVTTTDNTPYFSRREYDPAQYSHFFLNLAKGLYDVIAPTFGWVDFHHGLRTTHEDIENLALPIIYWANFFGPAYVKKLGRSKILSAPAWSIEPLSDGGILDVLAPSPDAYTSTVSPETVKRYFSVL